MVLVELREDALNNALSLVDEGKKSIKKTKLILCELEDALYECFDGKDEASEDYTGGESYEGEEHDEDGEMNYRGRRAMRMRHHYDDSEFMAHRGRRGAMRMRRNRYGRYAY